MSWARKSVEAELASITLEPLPLHGAPNVHCTFPAAFHSPKAFRVHETFVDMFSPNAAFVNVTVPSHLWQPRLETHRTGASPGGRSLRPGSLNSLFEMISTSSSIRSALTSRQNTRDGSFVQSASFQFPWILIRALTCAPFTSSGRAGFTTYRTPLRG